MRLVWEAGGHERENQRGGLSACRSLAGTRRVKTKVTKCYSYRLLIAKCNLLNRHLTMHTREHTIVEVR